MPPKKRTAAKPIASPASKKIRVGAAIKVEPDFQGSSTRVSVASKASVAPKASATSKASAKVAKVKGSSIAAAVPAAVANKPSLKGQFIDLFSQEEYKGGITNTALKKKFGASYSKLVPIINELTKESRLVMSRAGVNELHYSLVSADVASKFNGLDTSAKMVYQVIERAGNMGIWTKDIRLTTNIQQQALNKIFKALETRRLIKPVKSVTAKSKKLYMLYNLTPAKELTGGVWYSDLEFDHEFISELRTFVMHCLKRLNQGRGVTLAEIQRKMVQAKVSRIELSVEEVQQLVQTLCYDNIVEEGGETDEGEIIYVQARRVTPMCEFKWWDNVLSPDFHFRRIVFEDGLELAAHEPHYHTA